MRHYEPPKQSGIGQLFDSLFLLALVYLALFVPLVFGLAGSGTTTEAVGQPTWGALHQNPTMQAQWQKLGYTADSAASLVTTRFDYSIDPLMLGLTAIVIVGYFIFMIRMSEKEYRQVIREKFGA